MRKMDTEQALLIAGIGLVALEGARRFLKKVLADGKITLDEVIEAVDLVKELPSLSQIKKMKKAELVALCEEHGLDADGVKADLIQRLEGVLE
jgi:hypothetical protein